jgi:hypothetical protein
MSSLSVNPRIITIIRWIARIWTIPIFVFALGEILIPDPYAVQPVPLADWISLGFLGVSILGLLLAWRWEGLGGAIAIAGFVGHVVAFGITRGYWWFGALGSLAFILVLPGILFLVCWALSRGKRKLAAPMNSRSATR